MVIRKASEADAKGIASVLKQIKEIKSLSKVTVEEVHRHILAGLRAAANSQTSTILVGIDDQNEVAGYCSVHWVPFLFLPGGEAYITELFVKPEEQGFGLGSKLLGEVEKISAEFGCYRLILNNSREDESYKRSFYKNRNWMEREQMANFIKIIQDC